MSDITIPQIIEGYSDCRAVWFGKGATLTVAEQTVSFTGTSSDTDAYKQLAGLTTSDGGYELSTNGESDIASMSWNKDTDSPAGVLSLQLFPRQDYLNKMSPDDVLLVYGRADKVSAETLIAMVSIDAINESRSVSSNGATVMTVSIQARDLGKLLMETPTVYDAAFGGLVTKQFFSQFVQAFTQGTAQGGPSVVVQTMLAIFFSLQQNFVTRSIGQSVEDIDGVADPTLISRVQNKARVPLRPWRFPGNDSISMFSFLDTSAFVQTPMVGALLVDASLLQNAANLWALCEMYSNRIVNEFFIDTRDLVPGFDAAHKRMGYYAKKYLERFGDSGAEQSSQAEELSDAMRLASTTADEFSIEVEADATKSVIALVHRQLPYDTFSFFSLPTTIVYETEVFESSVGVNSSEVCNLFRIRFPGLIEGVAQDLQFGVHINRASIEAHGIRRYEGESIYVWTNARQGNEFIASPNPTYEFYQSLVTTWHAYNERLLSGSLSMRYRPDIRVGTRLTFVKTHLGRTLVSDFYIQRVSHSYSPIQGASRTEVDLIRGVTRDGLSVEAFKESHLFWTHEGGALNPNPYEVVLSEDVLGVTSGPSEVPNIELAPGDQ